MKTDWVRATAASAVSASTGSENGASMKMSIPAPAAKSDSPLTNSKPDRAPDAFGVEPPLLALAWHHHWLW